MITWAKIILAVLRLLEWLIEEAQKHRWINEGEKRAIARATAEVLRKQEFANETLKEITALPNADLDDLLRSLEPDSGGQLLSDVQEGNPEKGRRVDSSIQRSERKTGDK